MSEDHVQADGVKVGITRIQANQLGVLLLGKVSAPGCAASLWALPTGSVLLPGKDQEQSVTS